MKMIIKLAIVCIICLAGILLIYILGVFLYALLSEFKPPQVEEIIVEHTGKKIIHFDQELHFLTWNIGYGGLGKEMDFFYEGGSMVRPVESLSKNYLQGISDMLIKQDSIDIILLQEIDFDSKRSYFVDQSQLISTVLPDYNETSGVNYFSKYVPVPFLNPMGKVKSGLVTYSKYEPYEAIRMATPGKYSLPKRLFMLRRCFLITRYHVDNSKELILINLHNSAFEDADEMRKEELNLLKQLIINEYEKGNYVIAGGDWNQNPPDMELRTIKKKYNTRSVWPVEKDFLPKDWIWAFDASIPTNRDVHEPFNLKSTTCTVLDYFVTSPNIQVISTKAVDLGFEFSDHQPVIIQLKLIP
ncbi:MAG: endonuclease/exonuclease/phosphatase family protein [Bacteroidales bacterium]|nr:endonuclease/exonuclease/phosphatase family protein [Bacteroidales bacterium]